MSDRLRSAINNAIKVFVAGLGLIALQLLADASDWVNNGEVIDLGTYKKGVLLLVVTAATAVVSAVIDWLKTYEWFPGQPPVYPPPPPPAPEV